jgi:hypothetical protein
MGKTPSASALLGDVRAWNKRGALSSADIEAAVADAYGSKKSGPRRDTVKDRLAVPVRRVLSASEERPNGTLTHMASGAVGSALGSITGDEKWGYEQGKKLEEVSEFVNPLSWGDMTGTSLRRLWDEGGWGNTADAVLNLAGFVPGAKLAKGASVVTKPILAAAPAVLKDAARGAGHAVGEFLQLGRNYAPLEGLPAASIGPNATAKDAAEDYMAGAGRQYRPARSYAPVVLERAQRIAQAFEDMPHAPDDPEVKAAYDAMIKETLDQWNEIKKTGLKVDFIEGDDPYGSPMNALRDIHDNNHLWVFPTDDGFGGSLSSDVDISGNPLLQVVEGETINGKPVRANDIFRIVHDYFGHAKEGVGFRAPGEENAWRAHAALYSPEARRAMTTETRGQNSWVNYGPFGEFNRTAGPGETQYAPQKIGLLPDWVLHEGAEDFLDHPDMYRARGQLDTLNYDDGTSNDVIIRNTEGLEARIAQVEANRARAREAAQRGTAVVDEQGNPRIVYHGTPFNFDEFGDRARKDWFTENPDQAAGYASARRVRKSEGDNIRPAFLDIRNPLDLSDAPTHTHDPAHFADRYGLDIRGEMEPGVTSAYGVYTHPSFVNAARAAGYDGLKVPEGGNTTWAPLSASQIKPQFSEEGQALAKAARPAKSGRNPSSGKITAEGVLRAASSKRKPGEGFTEWRKGNDAERGVLFDYSRLSEVPDVPQVPMERYKPPRGPSARIVAALSDPRVEQGINDYVKRGTELGGKEWYNTEPLRQRFTVILGENTGQAYSRFMDAVAATSPRSTVPDNIRTASFYHWARENGRPVDKVAPGYGSVAQNLHQSNMRKLADEGGWDIFANPKPASFSTNLQGNQANSTIDTHNFRLPGILSQDPRFLETTLQEQFRGGKKSAQAVLASNYPGLSGASIDEATKAMPDEGLGKVTYRPQKWVESGEVPMDLAVTDPAMWATKPKDNEYGYYEDWQRQQAAALGISPAQYQASMWVGAGDATGLASPPEPFLRTFEARVKYTADRMGVSPEEVLDAVIRGDVPLL